MTNLKTLLDVLHESTETSTPAEIKSACELIIDVQAMNGGERDCIYAAFRNGPLFDGDVPCKSGRNSLLSKGYMAKVVVRKEDGYNACTNKGAWAYRILQAIKDGEATP